MGALRFKEDVDEILEKDPYELFQIESPHRTVRRLSPGTLRAAGAGVVVAMGVAAATFWHAKNQSLSGAEVPYAYFEVKAIDPDGRAVAGATVKESGKIVGLTDSFGEWRRFMPVTPGTTVMLELSKKTVTGTLQAVKGLAVPPSLPKSGDLELTGSVALARGAEAEPTERDLRAPRMVTAEKVEKGGKLEKTGKAEKAAEAVQAGAAVTSAAGNEADSAIAANAQWVPPQSSEAAGFDATKMALFVDARGFAPLAEVMQALKHRAQDLGVALDIESPFQIVVRDLKSGDEIAKDEAHLIQVQGILSSGKGKDGKLLFTFVRNYQDEAIATARDILWAASVHAPVRHWVERSDRDWIVAPAPARLWDLTAGRLLATDTGRLVSVVQATGDRDTLKLLQDGDAPCPNAATRCALSTPTVAVVPPVPGWTRLNLRVTGSTDGVLIYASGFQATSDDGHVYGFWGHPGGGVNLTAVRDGRVIYRAHSASPLKGQVLTVALPSLPLSKR